MIRMNEGRERIVRLPEGAGTGARAAADELRYMTGFGGEFETEALPGALPVGRNSPQKVPYGLYAEQLSGTAFTAPRAENRRSWLYRIRPSTPHKALTRTGHPTWATAPLADPPDPNRYRWGPWAIPDAPTDFLSGLSTTMANGDAEGRVGCAIHVYVANRPMAGTAIANLDGEMLIAPQEGRLSLVTEMGRLTVAPGEIAVVPRAVRFRVDLMDGTARGFVGENYGNHLRLPDLGPIGANGLANARDFQTPVAAYEDRAESVRLFVKHCGSFWETTLDRSPFDVVAWHGNLAPYKYDLARFMALNTVTYDHADPSIFTVLTSPSGQPGVANLDFVIFPPRWLVAEDTFRPPWFHRNVMSEFVAAIQGSPEARAKGFPPGSFHLHNCHAAHGPDPEIFERASNADLAPQRDETLAIMFESRLPFRPTRAALENAARVADYDGNWDGIEVRFTG